MQINKKGGYTEAYSKDKLHSAIAKAMLETEQGYDKTVATEIANTIDCFLEEECSTNKDFILTPNYFHDNIIKELAIRGRRDVIEKYVNFYTTKDKKKRWDMTDLQLDIWTQKYQHEGETFDEWIERISGGNKKIAKFIREKKLLFGGRILSNRGIDKKITYSNCYVLSPPEDNIESIFETAGKLARTYSYGGGVGIDISKLRPRGAAVNNSARETTGAVSFMDLYSLVTGTIGQNGRRGALMISMDCNHPDLEEFIDVKTDLTRVTKANISIRVDSKFMEAVTHSTNNTFSLTFTVESTGEQIVKEVDARKLFMKLAENNWRTAEPGILFWDEITKWNLLSDYDNFEFAGVNPCAEEPLPAGGSCLLLSINLSEFVSNPFTSRASFDMPKFNEVVKEAVKALNEVLDEGLQKHPLQEQKDSVRDWRQIGLGIMGLGDMLIKLRTKYGSERAIMVSEAIAHNMINAAVEASALLAKEHGPFPMFDYEKTVASTFYMENVTHDVDKLVKQYGMRNSQLLTIAPTGSISTMLDVTGGIEPVYATSYTRKTESLNDGDTYYKVYTPIVRECMDALGITNESLLPDYVVTAYDIPWDERLEMQAVWQTRIDASISSTVNLPNSATVEDVFNLYVLAWKFGLKGVTIFRDGCERGAIITVEDDEQKEVKSNNACPTCGMELERSGGCSECKHCGWAKCSL